MFQFYQGLEVVVISVFSGKSFIILRKSEQKENEEGKEKMEICFPTPPQADFFSLFAPSFSFITSYFIDFRYL